MIAVYGFPPGMDRLGYETYVQLVLNLERVRLQRAVDFAQGMGAAQSSEELHESWADAMAIDPSEVGEIHFQMAKARAVARRQARLAAMGPFGLG